MYRKLAVPSLLLSLLVSGCSLMSYEAKFYKKDYDVPKEKSMSFASSRALAAGATLQNMTAARVYYKGCEAESKEAKILLDMSYRFLGLAGVNSQFDPADPESVKKIFDAADRALEEKERALYQLREEVKTMQHQLATGQKIIQDKEAQLIDSNGKWSLKFDNLWRWFIGIVSFVVIFVLGLGVAQVLTGIPFLSALFGGIKTIFLAARQTIQGIEDLRNELKAQAESSGDPAKRAEAKILLRMLDEKLSRAQDESVKVWIARQKAILKRGG